MKELEIGSRIRFYKKTGYHIRTYPNRRYGKSSEIPARSIFKEKEMDLITNYSLTPVNAYAKPIKTQGKKSLIYDSQVAPEVIQFPLSKEKNYEP